MLLQTPTLTGLPCIQIGHPFRVHFRVVRHSGGTMHPRLLREDAFSVFCATQIIRVGNIIVHN